MKKAKLKVMAVLAVLILAAAYYYAALPALNLHSADTIHIQICKD